MILIVKNITTNNYKKLTARLQKAISILRITCSTDNDQISFYNMQSRLINEYIIVIIKSWDQ